MMTNITLIHNDSSKITNLITQLTIQNDSSNTRMSAADYSRVEANGEPLNRISGGRTAQGNEFPWFDFNNIQSYNINH